MVGTYKALEFLIVYIWSIYVKSYLRYNLFYFHFLFRFLVFTHYRFLRSVADRLRSTTVNCCDGNAPMGFVLRKLLKCILIQTSWPVKYHTHLYPYAMWLTHIVRGLYAVDAAASAAGDACPFHAGTLALDIEWINFVFLRVFLFCMYVHREDFTFIVIINNNSFIFLFMSTLKDIVNNQLQIYLPKYLIAPSNA